MEDLWTRLKNAPQVLLNALKRHGVTVYCCLLVFLLSLCLLVIQDIKHTGETLKLHNEQSILMSELEEVNGFSFDQINLIQRQVTLIEKYQNALESAKGALGDQGDLINDLINYLKKIGHWPPKEPRPTPKIDQDKWITSNEKI
tara:strand:- start:1677 stop:2108 length:432 start_codon:yes stop_codon:yes gene_type:complete